MSACGCGLTICKHTLGQWGTPQTGIPLSLEPADPRDGELASLRQQLAAAQANACQVREELAAERSRARGGSRWCECCVTTARELAQERGRTWEAWVECERLRADPDSAFDALDEAMSRIVPLEQERDTACAELVREHGGRKAAVAQMQAHHSTMQGKLNAMSDAWAADRALLTRLENVVRAACRAIIWPRGSYSSVGLPAEHAIAMRKALPACPPHPPTPDPEVTHG